MAAYMTYSLWYSFLIQMLSVSTIQVTRLKVDPGDHKAVTQKLRSLPDVTHVLYLGRSSGSAADRDLAADLEGFRSLVAAARAAGCALQMTQFTSAEDLTKGAAQFLCICLASGFDVLGDPQHIP
jgi:hypothetical protein